jgi:hypothetical protein
MSSESTLQWHLPDFIAIQIYEPDPPRLQFLFQSTLSEDQNGVPLMTWAFTNQNRFRSQSEERARRSPYQPRCCVHLAAWDVLHQVRLQEDGLAAKIEPE